MESITKRKCISARIFKNPLYEGCANGGISERFDSVLIPCYNGHIEVDMDNLPENFCRLVARDVGGIEYVHVEPIGNGVQSFMSGGTFVYSSDSRFSELTENGGYPVALHDRVEG